MSDEFSIVERLLEDAWGLVVRAADWEVGTDQSREWRTEAERWRDRWHAHLFARHPQHVGRYRKRPLEVEAQRWDGTPVCATAIIDWALTLDGTVRYASVPQPRLEIDTHEGTMRAERGDWIIRGVAGEFYPCKPEIFAKTYERVDEGGEC